MSALSHLPAAVAREVFATLCAILPPPIPDTPEARASRDELAMAAVAALHPSDAIEARLAADIVAAEAFATDCLDLARAYRNDIAATLRCRAQAAALLREMRGLLRDYRRMQAEQENAETATNPAAMQRAGGWSRDVAVSAPEPAEPTAEFSTLTEAEQYAVIYPERARRIRAAGGLPTGHDFGPPEPEIVAAIVHGTSPILRALDVPATEAATSRRELSHTSVR
jgi:hypothetical protein